MVIKPSCASTPEGCTPAPAPDPVASAPATSAGIPSEAAPGNPAAAGVPVSEAPDVTKNAVASGYIVQVAAVSKQQDADALVAALRRKQYQVFVVTPATDTLFHVQMGPFSEAQDAEAIRSRLVADGYNPIVKR